MIRQVLTTLAASALLVACSKKQEAATAPATTFQTLLQSESNPVPFTSPTAGVSGKFEGEIVVEVKNGSGTPQKVPASVTFDVKGDKVRYEPAAASVRAVDDLGAQHAFVVSDSKKAYTDIDTRTPPDKAKTQEVRLERSTKQEKVAGLSCEDWTIDDGNEKADVCAAKGIAFFDPSGDARPGNAEPSWARAMTLEKAFPLRVLVHDRSGKEEYRAEAFEVNWKKVDDSAFQVPTGFKKADLTPDLKVASLP